MTIIINVPNFIFKSKMSCCITLSQDSSPSDSCKRIAITVAANPGQQPFIYWKMPCWLLLFLFCNCWHWAFLSCCLLLRRSRQRSRRQVFVQPIMIEVIGGDGSIAGLNFLGIWICLMHGRIACLVMRLRSLHSHDLRSGQLIGRDHRSISNNAIDVAIIDGECGVTSFRQPACQRERRIGQP